MGLIAAMLRLTFPHHATLGVLGVIPPSVNPPPRKYRFSNYTTRYNQDSRWGFETYALWKTNGLFKGSI